MRLFCWQLTFGFYRIQLVSNSVHRGLYAVFGQLAICIWLGECLVNRFCHGEPYDECTRFQISRFPPQSWTPGFLCICYVSQLHLSSIPESSSAASVIECLNRSNIFHGWLHCYNPDSFLWLGCDIQLWDRVVVWKYLSPSKSGSPLLQVSWLIDFS